MAEKSGSLLDAMMADHAAGVTADDLERAQEAAAAPPAREATPPPVDTQPRKWAADPDANVCGLRIGGRFELHNGGPDVDGVWTVTALKLPLNAGPEARVLVAARPEGGPPFLQISEADFAEEIEIGNAVVVSADARG